MPSDLTLRILQLLSKIYRRDSAGASRICHSTLGCGILRLERIVQSTILDHQLPSAFHHADGQPTSAGLLILFFHIPSCRQHGLNDFIQ